MKICLGIGYPIKSSRSPSIHNAAYKKLGIDDQFIYLRAEVKPRNLKKVMEGLKTLNKNKTFPLEVRGISVTMPLKREIIKYLDKVSKEVEKIGAVNTIVNKHGLLIGYNTDWIGALTALEQKTKLRGKKVAVIGAGGAARAIVYGLMKRGSVVKIFNRSLEHARKLAQEFAYTYFGLDSLEKIKDSDIIINTTSVGMNEDKSPVNKEFLNNNHIVFDAVYSPKETRLIRDAKEKKAQIVYGYEMLLYQGIAQFELYTGMKAPVETMRKTLEDYEY